MPEHLPLQPCRTLATPTYTSPPAGRATLVEQHFHESVRTGLHDLVEYVAPAPTQA